MYSHKENVNILTALLVAHGVRHAVVCPGSRNAPIVHNLNECPHISCYAVTDERSAGFYALGMAQALHEPVAVCVTSGTALLNLLPAVAEAWYQHLPLVVISADRPQQWIGQLDGQTLPQSDALGRFVRRAVSLPEADAWYCNRLVNEALLDATADDLRPVHINVPITEPLFTFDVTQLPAVRQIVRTTPARDYDCLPPELVDGLLAAQRPMIVFGQTNPHDFEGCNVDFLFSHVIVLHEALSPFPSISHFDEVLADPSAVPAPPDFIVHVGDTIVSKRLRHFLRSATDAVTWRISPSGDVEDTFQNLRGIVVGDAEFILQALDQKMSRHNGRKGMDYRRQWLAVLKQAAGYATDYQPAYSQMAAVRCFEQQLSALRRATERDASFSENTQLSAHTVHYANSSAIRLANIYARHHVWCNRGVNGIEGSLSTAAGFSVVTPGRVFCVIGDLSFFYDQNALWNRNLRGNLRVLLLNNGGGAIFSQLPGLEQSPSANHFVAGRHATTAEGICRQNHVGYRVVNGMEALTDGISWLLTQESARPLLLEVMTDAGSDVGELKNYYSAIKL